MFLWVILVVRSLLTGLRNADRTSDLQKRLRDFPETLKKYFGDMLAWVEPIYREETAQAFTFALAAAEPLSLLIYSFLDEEYLDSVLASADNTLTTNDIIIRKDDMRKRLNGRCKGLLEIVRRENSSRKHLPILKVDFLHRTVHDFLLTEDIKKILAKNLGGDFNPNLRLCKTFLSRSHRLAGGRTSRGSDILCPRS